MKLSLPPKLRQDQAWDNRWLIAQKRLHYFDRPDIIRAISSIFWPRKRVSQMSDCTVYIDEAGDLGINRGTKWFVLSAVIVEKSAESTIRANMNQIKTKLNIREIHLRKVADYNKRAYIVSQLECEPFTYMNILVDTTKFDATKIPDTNVAYNYVCKYLLQRVSWFLETNSMIGDVILSARGTSRDGELIKYIQKKLLPYPDNAINSAVFGKISAKTAASWDLLQLADVCATTMFLTYEINSFGFCTPCFSMSLQDHLYRKHGRIDSYGIKFFTSDMKPNLQELRSHRVCAKKERTPGATTT